MFPTDIQLHVIHVDIVADKYSVGSELVPKVVLHSSPKGLEAWTLSATASSLLFIAHILDA